MSNPYEHELRRRLQRKYRKIRAMFPSMPREVVLREVETEIFGLDDNKDKRRIIQKLLRSLP